MASFNRYQTLTYSNQYLCFILEFLFTRCSSFCAGYTCRDALAKLTCFTKNAHFVKCV